MLENIKSLLLYKSVDKNIKEAKYDLALEKLNYLIRDGYKLECTFLKRGKLCQNLLMLEDAYSDFTYVITHFSNTQQAYECRMYLNFEMSNYQESIHDAEVLQQFINDDFELYRIQILSYSYLSDVGKAKQLLLKLFNNEKYRAIQFLLTETAKNTAENELSRALKLLDVIEFIDPDNPIKILKEANIYELAGDIEKSKQLMKSIDSAFPKYLISHFRFTDMYEDRNMLEVSFLLELKIFDKNNLFKYPFAILEGYLNQMEGHIINSRECFERAIEINPNKPEAYVLLGQTFQLMSGYDNPEYRADAEKNYKKAMDLYQEENLTGKVESMRRQIKHLNSTITIGK